MTATPPPGTPDDVPSPVPDLSPAARLGTPVDGVEVLAALSPSRAADFLTCPLMYRLRTIDRLPEAPSPAAVRGTVVHKVLEDLFDLPAAARTPSRAADLLTPAWEAVLQDEPAVAEMFGGEGPDVSAWLASCREVLDRWFTLEDPQLLEPAERELYVETLLDSRLLLRGFVDRVDVAPDGRIRVVDYKGLAVDTPLPTPTGWTTMGDVAVGDQLVGRDGLPTRVLAKSDVHHRPCYRVRFRDGSSVVADNVHLWSVVTSYRQQQTPVVVDTEGLGAELEALRAAGRPNSLWVEAASPLDCPSVHDLPISPWLLGAWLGDGDSGNGGITVGRQDLVDTEALVKANWDGAVLVREETTAFRLTPSKRHDACTFGHDTFRPPTKGHPTRRCTQESTHGGRPSNVSLSRLLRDAGLLHNKHIPAAYLRSGLEQRLELLRGLMDTDGWWNETRRRTGFTTTNDQLAADVLELLRTLGVNPPHFSKPYVNAVRADRTWHVIEFTPTWFNPFALPRKAAAADGALTDTQRALGRRRILASVEPVDSVPTQCVAVDAADKLYLCGRGFIPTHNTGSSPAVGYEAKALFQMRFYALVIWRTRGVVPSVLQLVYLGNGEILRYEPDEADLLATERKVQAIWDAIRHAEESGDWRESPSRLCDWCSFKPHCPAYGGTPPPLPERGVPRPDPSGDLDTDETVTTSVP